MKPTIRFIHSADLHLDSPYKGMQGLPASVFKDVKESTVEAYNRLIDLAITEQVDFVLFVGDLFDQQSTSLKSVLTFKKGLERLNEHGILAYISYGNHDFGIGDKIDLTFPENTYIFASEDVTSHPFIKNEEEVARIYGFSFEKRAVKKKKVREYEMNYPELYQIGTLHGSIQSNTEHDVYAPFQLADLKSHPADYWALGHIHKREILSEDPFIIYPGNIQGRHINEPDEKGCYVVEMNEYETTVDFQPLQSITFEVKTVADIQSNSLEELVEELLTYKESWRTSNQKLILRLNVYFPESFSSSLDQNQLAELHELVNENEEDEPNWIWIQAIKPHTEVLYDREELKESNQFIGEVLKTIDGDENTKKHLDILANNRAVNKHVKPFTDDAMKEIQEEAEQLIINELIKDGEA